jgi:hypothetical protein
MFDFTNFSSWCVCSSPAVELRYLTTFIPDSLKVGVGRRQRAHAGDIYWLYNKPNNAHFILLTDDGRRASFRKVVFEPNEMMGNVQHICHTIIMEDILTLHIGNSRPQSNTFTSI